ncbi:uncharacterized protein LOC129289373 [Prosopis cineraria]|uniref:uncharacterized protein LOC129289373 n=1 Tax=Prosopis cineraria TaxID=364024 RepID=UPI00240EC0D1|nr:uncharacterized protein LOC129289373 [Prosopis cineraria]
MTLNGDGCGGVIRDSSGRLIEGFMHGHVEGGSLTAELWAILVGLKAVWDSGKRRIIVEWDLLEALNAVEGEVIQQHHEYSLIEEIKCMLGRDWEVNICHINREGNSVADYLAKEALRGWPGLFGILNSSFELTRYFLVDLNNLPSS